MPRPVQSLQTLALATLLAASLCAGTGALAASAAAAPGAKASTAAPAAKASRAAPAPKASTAARSRKAHALDRSGQKRRGKASFYARRFAGQTMADGTPLNPRGNNAASKTLPLGTVARVTNLETGQSAAVEIRDRGPYVAGRIVDLSPATAQAIGISRKDGVAPVEVAPLSLPPP